MITAKQEDLIFNALLIGMDLNDAYIYAGLTPSEITSVTTDDVRQAKYHQLIKEREYSLLSRLDRISQKQEKMGKESATTWMLEHMYPRYSSKGQTESIDLTLNLVDSDPAHEDNVLINKGSK